MNQNKTNKILISIFTIFALLLVSNFIYQNYRQIAEIKSSPSQYVKINKKILEIELADTFEKQVKGLSGHEKLSDNQSMLFKFNNKRVQNFWMKDMLFPLDIIWIDGNKIVKIDKNLPPEGNIPKNIYTSSVPVNYVLEITGGVSDKCGFKVGDKVTIKL